MRLQKTIYLVSLVAASATLQAATPPPAGHLAFFESEVRPLLAEHCYKCHSTTAKKLKANLYLDSADGILAGGDSGPAVKPGEPDASLLIEAVRYHDSDLQMPPKSKLPDDAITTLEKWVTLGAPWPAAPKNNSTTPTKGFDLESRRAEHWCWHPVADPPPPAVKNTAWPANPIDRDTPGSSQSRAGPSAAPRPAG